MSKKKMIVNSAEAEADVSAALRACALDHNDAAPKIILDENPPPAAASTADRILPDQIIELILLRLPAIELVRLKKLWPTIISSPSFVSAHLKHFKSDPSSHYLLARDSMLITPKGLPPAPLDSIVSCTSEYMAIVGSVNGLICLAGISRRCPTPDEIFILNPVTRLSRKLPSRSKYRITPDTRSVKLAFWWDDDSDLSTGGRGVYKVAKIVTIPHVKCMLEIWDSSVPHKWTQLRALEFNFNDIPAFSLAHPCDVLIEGDAAYWIVRNYEGNFSVLSLDLKSLGVKFIPLSEQQMITQSELYAWRAAGGLNIHMFGASCNGSFVLLRNRFSGNRMYDIWTLSRKGGSDWVKCEMPIRLDFRFLSCVGSINGELILKGINGILAMYDLTTGRRTCRFVEDSNLKYVRILSVHDFVASLVSFDGFESNELPGVGFTWPSPYFGASGWIKMENEEIDE